MTRRWGPAVAVAGSVAAFCGGFFVRMNAAYGPFNLSARPDDWVVLWELWRHGQIASGIVAEAVGLAAAAATVPWVLWALLARPGQR